MTFNIYFLVNLKTRSKWNYTQYQVDFYIIMLGLGFLQVIIVRKIRIETKHFLF